MALLRDKLQQASQKRPSNTAHTDQPDWSSLCNNVFEEFLDPTNDLFDFANPDARGRNSSEDSGNLFDFTSSSEQSNQTAHTAATSPIAASSETTSLEPSKAVDLQAHATQPTAKEPVGFWRRTLRVLERSAAKTEDKQHRLRNAKSHPDFLSLGGCPSPPVRLPSPPARVSSPTEQTLSVQRRRAHASANGSQPPGTPHATSQGTPTVGGRQRAHSQHSRAISSAARSVSRGRPSGVTKASLQAPHAHAHATSCHNTYATVRTARHASLSPHKMMNPSRYRAGFKDVWADKLELNAKKYELQLPIQTMQNLPVSPPPSGRCMQGDDFASFGSPQQPQLNALAGYEEQLSPLATNFQQARLHTPATSPFTNPAGASQQSYFEHLTPAAHGQWVPQSVPLHDDMAHFSHRTSSLVPNRSQQLDFGFSSSPEDVQAWDSAHFGEPSAGSTQFGSFCSNDAFMNGSARIAMPSASAPTRYDSIGLGLGISGLSCDPMMVSGNYTTAAIPDTAAMPPNAYHIPSSAERSTIESYYTPGSASYLTTRPSTPYRRCSSSVSPPPATTPRSRRDSSQGRRASRHRRTKSTSCTPRHSIGGLDKSGFVNFTPHDSNKILSGVAPSGSSKTKARREKEAADKRRRLSQAAMRAVVEAGGDVESLQKAGVFA